MKNFLGTAVLGSALALGGCGDVKYSPPNQMGAYYPGTCETYKHVGLDGQNDKTLDSVPAEDKVAICKAHVRQFYATTFQRYADQPASHGFVMGWRPSHVLDYISCEVDEDGNPVMKSTCDGKETLLKTPEGCNIEYVDQVLRVLSDNPRRDILTGTTSIAHMDSVHPWQTGLISVAARSFPSGQPDGEEDQFVDLATESDWGKMEQAQALCDTNPTDPKGNWEIVNGK